MVLSGYGLSAQTRYPDEANWQKVCDQAAQAPVKAPAFTMSESELKACDSFALYYGYEDTPNPKAALECAFYHRDASVLSMLYANGMGVERDYNRAITFACEEKDTAAEMEMQGRIGHLEYLRDHPGKAAKFDFCDDATSGMMEGTCANINEQLAAGRRERRIKELSAGWSAEAKGALQALEKWKRSLRPRGAGMRSI